MRILFSFFMPYPALFKRVQLNHSLKGIVDNSPKILIVMTDEYS